MKRAVGPIAGFTLVELVVALALLGLIAVTAFESLRFGQRAHAKVVERGGAAWSVFAAQRFVRNLIESAYPLEPAQTQDVMTYGLVGGSDELVVTAPAPLAASVGGLQRFELMPKRNARGSYDLIVRWRSDLAPESSATEETLVEDITSVEWSYMDARERAWRDDWQEQRTLPRLVKLSVTFAASDPRTWPDLIMTPLITDDANCAFDVIAQRCRSGS